MFMLYVLKGVGAGAVIAVTELWASGDYLLAVLAVPMLLTMWYATRLYARRRARSPGDHA